MNDARVNAVSMGTASMRSASMGGSEPPMNPLVFYDALVGDGVAEIQPNIVASPTMRIGAEYEVLNVSISRTYDLFGTKGDGSNQLRIAFNPYNGACYFYVHGSPTNPITLYIGKRKIGDIVHAFVDYNRVSGEVYMRVECGSTFAEATSAYTKIGNRVMYFRASYIMNNTNTGRHKRFYVYDKGAIVQNLLPCKFMGEAGMYDIVNKVFYGNANSEGSFSVEGEGYEMTLHDALKSDGKAYINTGYYPDPAHKYTLSWKSSANSMQVSLMGGQYFNIQDYCGIRVYITYRSGTAKGITGLSPDTIHTMIVNPNFEGKDYILDGKAGTCGNSNDITKSPLWLFDSSYGVSRRCYEENQIRGLKIETSEKALFHLLPCTYNGEAGMYDLVSNKFFGNANSEGSFSVE